MSRWASSSRSFSGLANFWVRVCGDCFEEDRGGGLEAFARGGTISSAPTTMSATATHLVKLGRFIVRAEDFLRHSRLYLKASWTWMRRSRNALPGHYC